MLVGLGQTNDYVEQLHIGAPSGHVRRFSQAVIPNSRLVVFPHPYDQPDAWELRLYLEPRQQLYVGVALVVVLLALGVLILALELWDQAQDTRERKRLEPTLPL